ncbi:hypothetical protein BCR42DRAFT_398735 [Absidia repens]|uniref:SWIM-type domain-containing protein n=1 Tax=Absidia repens TaxID=90262 RepID=A0A1X2HX22_9FUNG|nr:hypothetical protein BCR42DRAFT_398735 [Absidia repens]
MWLYRPWNQPVANFHCSECYHINYFPYLNLPKNILNYQHKVEGYANSGIISIFGLLLVKSKWAGPWCHNLQHYNSRTTQRAENVHASLKYTLRKNESLTSLLEKIGDWIRQGQDAHYLQNESEMNTFPIAVYKEEIFEDLMGKLSHSALTMLYNEYKQQKNTKKNTHCMCMGRQNFGLYCRHNFPTELSLDDINTFWYLKSIEYIIDKINHEAAISEIGNLLQSIHEDDLPDLVTKISNMIKENDSLKNESSIEDGEHFSLPPKATTKGRPSQKKMRQSAINKVNYHMKKNGSLNLGLSRWRNNSCFIDCTAEFLQKRGSPLGWV